MKSGFSTWNVLHWNWKWKPEHLLANQELRGSIMDPVTEVYQMNIGTVSVNLQETWKLVVAHSHHCPGCQCWIHHNPLLHGPQNSLSLFSASLKRKNIEQKIIISARSSFCLSFQCHFQKYLLCDPVFSDRGLIQFCTVPNNISTVSWN